MQQSSENSAVRIEAIALATNQSREHIERQIRAGKIPSHAFKEGRNRYWTLGTLRAWNPRVARRLDLILIALR